MARRKQKADPVRKIDPIFDFRGPWWMRLKHLRHAAIRLMEAWFQAKDYIALLALAITARKLIKSEYYVPATGGKFAIFATYPGQQVFGAHKRFIEKLAARGYHILIVSNNWKAQDVIRAHYGDAHSYIFRRPFGRDFGCYKDAMARIYACEAQDGINIERVVLFNDSVVTFEASEDQIINHLDDGQIPFAGIGENFEFNYHVGSYMLAFDGAVARSRRVRKYWRRYIPISTRRHSIHAGEMGLSKAISRSGFAPDVLLNVGFMRQRLEALSFAQLGRICEHMPTAFFEFYGGIWSILDGVIRDAMGPSDGRNQSLNAENAELMRQDLAALRAGLMGPGNIQDFELRNIGYRGRLMRFEEAAQQQLIEKSAKTILIEKLMNFIFRQSQVHAGTAVILFLGGFLMKKDIVFRQIVSPHALPSLLLESGVAVSQEDAFEIHREVSAKGHPYSLTKGKRLLYALGFI